MQIPEAKIQEVRERVDLIALVQRHGVELKKAGRSFKGLCPFHQEKTPSFNVWAEEKRFKCFGCQAGGDAITFLQRVSGNSFVDTVRTLAAELGIDLSTELDPGLKEIAQIKEATDFAARHFERHLWDRAVGEKAREYLRSRGLTEEVMRTFGLGWAPLAWTDLADALRHHGLLAFGEKAGLVAPRQRAEGYYDTFRGRIMIPIRSPEGRTIAFGGRLLEGDEGPKYLNSRESPLYAKSEVLYGTDQARDAIRKKKSAILTEGYFDCIGLHQAGLKTAIALCSTALTPGHLALLNRLEAKELVLLLDGDEAGRKAIERLAGPILNSGANAKIALLPDGEDPDTYARTAGGEGLETLVREALPLTAHLFTSFLRDGPAASFEDKMAAIERLRPVAAQIPVGLVRSAFFGSMARHFGLPASELEGAMRSKSPLPVRAAPKPIGSKREAPPDSLEASWAACIVRDATLVERDPHRVLDELKHMELRSLVNSIQSGSRPEEALYDASEEVKQALVKASDFLPVDPKSMEQAFLSVCRRLKLRTVEDRLRSIARETAKVAGASTELTQDSRDLLEERGQLLVLKRQLASRT